MGLGGALVVTMTSDSDVGCEDARAERRDRARALSLADLMGGNDDNEGSAGTMVRGLGRIAVADAVTSESSEKTFLPVALAVEG